MGSGTRGGWFRRLFSGAKAKPLDPDRTDLVVVASSFDDAEACSSALERGESTEPAMVAGSEVVLRHHLMLPEDTVDDARAIAAQDGYALGSGLPESSVTGTPNLVPGQVAVVLQRVQILDALHCSQERSRMAGLAQRRGGTVLGWDALQPARPTEAAAD